MAQTGYTPISIYYSATATNVPTAGNLVAGELAINTTDGKLYYKDTAGVVQVIAGKGGAGVAGGSNTQVQYNSSGSLAGSANMTFSGTALTLANDASISGLTVGKGGGAVASNTAVGNAAVPSNTTGIQVNGFGANALNRNTTGNANNAFGYVALYFNTTGASNTALGDSALFSNTTASNNTAVGYQSLYTNSTGTVNGAFGAGVLYANTTGSYNNAFGASDLAIAATMGANTTGERNNAFGNGALGKNTTGSYNSAFGHQSLVNNTTASNNTAVGYQALYSNITGGATTAFGYQALYSQNGTAGGQTAIGYQAGYSYVNSGTEVTSSLFVGYGAGKATSTGHDNSFIGGAFAGYANTSGSYNVAVGSSALQSNTTASECTAVGYQAGFANTTGTRNTCFGAGAGRSITTNDSNLFVGWFAGYNATGSGNAFIGGRNTTIGSASGSLITSGSNNTILGAYDGNSYSLDIRTASNYIVLSDGAGNPKGIFTSGGDFLVGAVSNSPLQNNNSLVVRAVGDTTQNHANGTASGSGYLFFGYNGGAIGSITQNGTTGVLYNLTSDYRLKNNPQALTGASEFIMALQPKTWDWWDGSGKGVGFIAHEFMEVAKYSGNGEKDAVDAEGKPVYQSIQPSSSEVMANLVALVQELNAKVTALETQLGK